MGATTQPLAAARSFMLSLGLVVCLTSALSGCTAAESTNSESPEAAASWGMPPDAFNASLHRALTEEDAWTELKAMAQRRASAPKDGNLLVVAFTDFSLSDAVNTINWVQAVEAVNVTNWLVLSFDRAATDGLAARNVPVAKISGLLRNCKPPVNCSAVERYAEKMHVRFKVIYNLLVWGYRVVVSDTGAVWRSPRTLEYLTEHGTPVDIAGQRDLTEPADVTALDMGLIFFNTTPAAKRLTLAAMDNAPAASAAACDRDIHCLEQAAFKATLQNVHIDWAVYEDHRQLHVLSYDTVLGDAVIPTSIPEQQIALRVALLPNYRMRDVSRSTFAAASAEIASLPSPSTDLEECAGTARSFEDLMACIYPGYDPERDAPPGARTGIHRCTAAVVHCTGRVREKFMCLRSNYAWVLKSDSGHPVVPPPGPNGGYIDEEGFSAWLHQSWSTFDWRLPDDYFESTSRPRLRTPLDTLLDRFLPKGHAPAPGPSGTAISPTASSSNTTSTQ
eukprot:jgi/Chlat1/4344/Chrsp29S04498